MKLKGDKHYFTVEAIEQESGWDPEHLPAPDPARRVPRPDRNQRGEAMNPGDTEVLLLNLDTNLVRIAAAIERLVEVVDGLKDDGYVRVAKIN